MINKKTQRKWIPWFLFVCAWNHSHVILHFYDIGKLNKQSWSRNSGINTNKICLHRPVSLLKVNNVCDHFHFQCNLHWPIYMYMYTIFQIKLFQMSKTYYSTVHIMFKTLLHQSNLMEPNLRGYLSNTWPSSTKNHSMVLTILNFSLNNIYSLSCMILWNNIVQYNIDWETSQRAYINLTLLAIQVRGGWNFIVKK